MGAGGDLAIDLKGVSKTYGSLLRSRRVHALRGIDMRVHRGEIFGLLGPNGAGKSTLVKILMTVIRPTACRGEMLGARVGHKGTLARVGYLPEHHKFPDHLTGQQVMDFFGALSNVGRAERRRRGGELLELVGIAKWKDRAVKGYSKGMRQRLGIAQSLVNDPDIVLLDEPTDGVDPVGRRDIRNILLEVKRRGKTVFLNSHLLSELEMVCDRVAILVQGVVARQGTIDELTADQRCYEVETEGADEGTLTAAAEGVEGGAKVIGGLLRLGATEAGPVQPVIDRLRAKGVVIRSVRAIRPSLEDLFMQAVTDPNTGEVLKPGAGDGPSIPAAKNGGGR